MKTALRKFMRMLRQARCLLLPLALSLPACSSVPRDIDPPRVNLVNIAPKEMTLFEQRYDVQLRIENPNDTDLTIKGMRFGMELNDKEFANGMSGEKFAVSRFGSEVVHVDVTTGLGGILRQLQDLGRSDMKMRYRLKGTAFVDSPGNWKLPFDEKGEIDFNTLGQPSESPSMQP